MEKDTTIIVNASDSPAQESIQSLEESANEDKPTIGDNKITLVSSNANIIRFNQDDNEEDGSNSPLSNDSDSRSIEDSDPDEISNTIAKDDMNLDQLLAQDIAQSNNPEVQATVTLQNDPKLDIDEDMNDQIGATSDAPD
jgi:hypothetical protein